jgi:nickel/cobalt transporter (NicO) family protein
MPDFLQALQNGSTHLWFFIPAAILVGALHGLEPGHSKTMMAAFIIAIRGTMAQAVLLGLSAAISHSLLIALLAAAALHFGSHWNTETIEPYMQLGSAVAIIALAAWMFLRTRRELHEAHHHHHEHHHDAHGEGHEFQDAHELEHANDIRQRFAGRTVTTPQIVLFGVTGGLIPCPAAFSILLVCLQLKRAALGVMMVASFSAGLALTMVATGAIAAWSVRHAQRKFRGFGEAMRRAPYISCVVLVLLAAYMAWHGWHGLQKL